MASQKQRKREQKLKENEVLKKESRSTKDILLELKQEALKAQKIAREKK